LFQKTLNIVPLIFSISKYCCQDTPHFPFM
jgi:hypothetical protein